MYNEEQLNKIVSDLGVSGAEEVKLREALIKFGTHSYRHGRDIGISDGYSEGFSDGYEEGNEEGYSDGYRAGENEYTV